MTYTYSKSSSGYKTLFDLMIYLIWNMQHSRDIAWSSSLMKIDFGARTLMVSINLLSLQTVDLTSFVSPMILSDIKPSMQQNCISSRDFGGLQ
jgi:hypothetical protein